jgi:hypothetical protein
MQIETTADLERIVGEQNTTISGQNLNIAALELKIRVLTALVDAHHDLFIKHGMAKPRPPEGSGGKSN